MHEHIFVTMALPREERGLKMSPRHPIPQVDIRVYFISIKTKERL